MYGTDHEYLDMLSEHGFRFYGFINVFTRTPIGFKHYCLDHIFIKEESKQNKKIMAGVIQICITDHFSIVLNIEIVNKIVKTENTLKSIDYIKLKEILEKEL